MTTSPDTPLSFADFENLLDMHGADLSRWPLEHVKPALALMQDNAQAAASFAQAERMDDLLRRGDVAPACNVAALQARIMTAIAGSVQTRDDLPAAVIAADAINANAPARGGLRNLFAPGGGLLMIGLIGFMMGFMQPASAQDTLLDGLVHGQDMVISGDGAAMGEF